MRGAPGTGHAGARLILEQPTKRGRSPGGRAAAPRWRRPAPSAAARPPAPTCPPRRGSRMPLTSRRREPSLGQQCRGRGRPAGPPRAPARSMRRATSAGRSAGGECTPRRRGTAASRPTRRGPPSASASGRRSRRRASSGRRERHRHRDVSRDEPQPTLSQSMSMASCAWKACSGLWPLRIIGALKKMAELLLHAAVAALAGEADARARSRWRAAPPGSSPCRGS